MFITSFVSSALEEGSSPVSFQEEVYGSKTWHHLLIFKIFIFLAIISIIVKSSPQSPNHHHHHILNHPVPVVGVAEARTALQFWLIVNGNDHLIIFFAMIIITIHHPPPPHFHHHHHHHDNQPLMRVAEASKARQLFVSNFCSTK